MIEKWLLELQTELALLDEVDTVPIERLRQAMPLITRIIADVKAHVLQHGFADQQAEINFFKRLKPAFYAQQWFEILYYNLRTQAPAGTPEMIRTYYEEELQQVFRFFRIQAFHYQYFKSKATELDHLYFVCGAQPADMPVLELVDPAPGFTTALDHLFAKFIAYERLQDHLLDLLASGMVQTLIKEKKVSRNSLCWTGESINLVELAYGIWLTGQVNNGNVSITEIMEWLELHFQVSIGRAFRRWSSISKRKRISPTKYVDQLKAAILKRLDDENGR